MTGPLRIGVLGAASIAPAALLRPARRVPGVSVESVATRDPHRAQTFARRHALPRFHPSYDALLDDSDIDAVYIALPNSLHLPWTLRALSAGKHVLCEKPLACNADEALQVAEAAERSGRVAAEAMAYLHHPLAARLVELTAQLGRLQHIEVFNCVPIFRRSDIRYQYDLGGGAAMDLAGYAISLVRLLAGALPEATGVEVRLARSRVDRWIAADLRLPSGATAKVTCSLWSTDFLRSDAKVRGEAGWMKVLNPFAPHLFHRVTSQIGGGRRIRERVRKGGSTYVRQLQAFLRAVREGGPVLTPARDAAQTLQVIDQMYRLAGLPVRHSMATGTP
jgi:predicted dehydrogenase